MKVAVTCIQLIRDIESWRSRFVDADLDVVIPAIPGQHLEGDELVRAMDGCVGVVAGDDQFTREVIDRLPDLRVIAKWGIGVDGIDAAAAAERGIVVRNTPGMFDDEVGDITMAYVVMVARHLALIDRDVRAGTWSKPPGTSLRDNTLGIIGLGGIGRATAVRAVAAGMRVIGSDPSPTSQALARDIGVDIVDLDELLPSSDFIAVNAPLNEHTYHLLDHAAFASMRRGVRVVNTGRGGVVDTDALVDALRNGTVAGAALDVMEVEPPPVGHPILDFDQVIFGSHNASNTLEASARVHDQAIQNLIDELAAIASP